MGVMVRKSLDSALAYLNGVNHSQICNITCDISQNFRTY